MFKVLHVDTGREWRGGQRQALLLHSGLIQNGIESFLLAEKKGELVKKDAKNIFGFDFKGELSLSGIVHLLKIIKDIKPHIVHSHDAHSLTPLVVLKALLGGFKLVHTRRVDFSINKNIFSKFKYTNNYIDKIVAISYAVKNVLSSDGVPDDKIGVIYSGVRIENPENFSCPNELKKIFSKEDKAIGCIANFADHKDHFTLLKAFEIVHNQNRNVKLILVGDGYLLESVKKFAEKLNCFKNIVFGGFREDVYNCMKCMDIFVMTSKKEGLCTSIIDALSFGLPVVATDAGGIPELVLDGVNGFICKVGDYEHIAEKIIYLINNHDIYEKMSNNAISSSQIFSVKNMVDGYLNLYKGLL